jgi:hypothetical protein
LALGKEAPKAQGWLSWPSFNKASSFSDYLIIRAYLNIRSRLERGLP